MNCREMPRSLADRIDRTSLSRASVGKGSLGRFSVATDISASSAATRHWVNSVSDIYGPDEIEELLQDLNRLELTTFEKDDYREFDIDGSQLGDDLDLFPASPAREVKDPPSPALSTRSWDSHTHYQQFKEPPDDYWVTGPPGHLVRPLHAAVCYCDINLLKTPKTLLRVLVLVTSVACFTSLLSAGTAKISVSALPHVTKLRLLVVVSVFCAMFSLLVVFLNISHLHALLPIDYGKMQFYVYLVVGALFLVSSTLVLYVLVSVYTVEYGAWVPQHTTRSILASLILGYICGLEAFLCSYESLGTRRYQKMEESSTNFTLQDAATSRAVTHESIAARSHPPPPRPNPPPAPRPIVRSQAERSGLALANQNYRHPPPPVLVPSPYSDIVNFNLQSNHNGGRSLAAAAAGRRTANHRMKRSASPDTSLYSSPPRSRPLSPQDLFDASAAASPRPTLPDRHGEYRRPSPSPPPSPPTAYHHHPPPPPSACRSSSAGGGDSAAAVQVNGNRGVQKHDNENFAPSGKHYTFNQISPRVQDKHLDKYRDTEGSEVESSWDSKLGDNSHSVVTSVRTSNHRLTRSSRENHNPTDSIHESLHAVPSRETGAIPKKRKTMALPSPAHPDEIISLPMDDHTPPHSASNRNYHNYAH